MFLARRPLLLLLWAAAVAAATVATAPRQHAPSLGTACGRHAVPSGTHVQGLDDHGHTLVIERLSGVREVVGPCRSVQEQSSSGGNDNPNNQWLAWYFTQTSLQDNGATLFSSQWSVPPLPEDLPSNICFFNGLQPTYDPRPYDFIIQPVLSTGDWVVGDFPNDWVISATMCHNLGNCIHAEPIKTSPGHTIVGTMTLLSTRPNSLWNISITDVDTGLGNSITYETTYPLLWGFVTLEHNPAGAIGDCDTLPRNSLSFVQNNLVPSSPYDWNGVIGDGGCDITTDSFANAPNLTIYF
jgi:hypothetical protein